jgi:hemoglobin-like flavoprotein
MSFEQIYDKSYERIVNRQVDGKDFFEAFYDNFLADSEEIRQIFVNTDMAKQKNMLKKSFYSLLIFYGSNQADDYIKKIATYHDKHHLNIRPELYDAWMDALIQTLKAFDEDFNDDVELAWRLILCSGITYMKFKHSHC